MLITVVLCIIGLAFAQAGEGYYYPKPFVQFDEGTCPPGSNGVYPECKDLSLSQTTSKCIIDWEQYKTAFNKTYANMQEEIQRQQLFVNNQNTIASHNALYEQGQETYSLCMNKFGDWSLEEYKQINGIDITKTELIDDEYELCDCDCNSSNDEQEGRSASSFTDGRSIQSENEANNSGIPDSKDWRKEGAVTSVKDQLNCASCWSFSAAGALEGQFYLKNGVLQSLSEQQLIDCSRIYANNGCNTGFMTNAFLYTRKFGILSEDEYPYEAKDNHCRGPPNLSKNRRFRSIPKGNEQMLKETIGKIGPVAVGLDAIHEKFMFYSEGVYFNPDCQPERISHAVVAIGYDTDEMTGMDYWIIKNSYGTSWGDGGYGKLARNKGNHCGITNLASYPIV